VKRLRWDPPTEGTLPKRPYRDTVLVYGGMAVLVVVIALLTGGGFVRAVVFAAVFFVIATLWSWRNWRNRLRSEQRRK
jgi:membrane protein implicated in regulation of membrane protease activity